MGDPYSQLGRVCWIEYLPGRGPATPDWVHGLVQERTEHLRSLPAAASACLRNLRLGHSPAGLIERHQLFPPQGTWSIVDIGPGEGVSSMALALAAPSAQVLGIEMDQRHLALAWPACLA